MPDDGEVLDSVFHYSWHALALELWLIQIEICCIKYIPDFDDIQENVNYIHFYSGKIIIFLV